MKRILPIYSLFENERGPFATHQVESANAWRIHCASRALASRKALFTSNLATFVADICRTINRHKKNNKNFVPLFFPILPPFHPPTHTNEKRGEERVEG